MDKQLTFRIVRIGTTFCTSSSWRNERITLQYRDSIASESFLRISKTRASCLSMSSFEIVVEAIKGCSGLMNKAGSASGFVCNEICATVKQKDQNKLR